MGLLDDAIRDHLDLKRRRGADPAEIERAEREALGPVRREPIASDEAAEHPAPSAGTDLEPEDLGAPTEEHAGVGPVDATKEGRFEHGQMAEDEDWDDYEDDEYEDDEYEDDDEFSPDEPGHGTGATGGRAGAAEATPEQPSRPSDLDDDLEATRSFEIEPTEEGHHGREDVLEETPDFLQDAPDHDRLWFEQRPPRDFDFDE
jgi:hypothetical protein